MTQTNAGTKAYFDGGRDSRGDGTDDPMTDTQLDDVYDWLAEHIGKPGRATADDLANHFYQYLGEQVLSHKRSNTNPTWT